MVSFKQTSNSTYYSHSSNNQSENKNSSNTNNSRERLKSILSTLAIFVLAPIIAIFLTLFVFQSYEVDGPSMETTLQNGDRLIVLKAPRTLARITRHSYIPNRGDIIIFDKKDYNEKRQLIKRVIALPGEKITIKNGTIKVYNQDNPNGFEPDSVLSYGNSVGTTTGDVEITLENDQLFVVGDNRNNSLDSRSFGPISADDVVGKLFLRLFPFSKARKF